MVTCPFPPSRKFPLCIICLYHTPILILLLFGILFKLPISTINFSVAFFVPPTWQGHDIVWTFYTGQESMIRPCNLHWQLRHLLRKSHALARKPLGSTYLADSSC